MIFVALSLWAYCFAKEKANSKSAPVTRFVQPWSVPQLEVADDCTILCGMWNALYASVEYGCVGRDQARLANGEDAAATGKISFCPDKTVIKPWTLEEELEFEAVYKISAELEQSELDVFNEMEIEREMRLSVHQWHMLLQEEIVVSQDRRRAASVVWGSSTDYSCFGGNGGSWKTYTGSRPTGVTVRHDWVISRFEFTFPDNGLLAVGGDLGGVDSTSFPDCIDYIYIRAGKYIDGIRFSGGTYFSSYYGQYGGAEYIVLAPDGRCLGNIKMKTGRLVDMICFQFNN